MKTPKLSHLPLFTAMLAVAGVGIVAAATPAAEPQDIRFFSGKDLTGWKGNDPYWSVEDGAIVGHADREVTQNEFIWSEVEVKDFYLVVDVKLTPDNRSAGIHQMAIAGAAVCTRQMASWPIGR